MIDPRNIRRASHTRAVVRFWVGILVQTVICLVLMLVAVWAVFALNALLHPPVDLNLQLPTI